MLISITLTILFGVTYSQEIDCSEKIYSNGKLLLCSKGQEIFLLKPHIRSIRGNYKVFLCIQVRSNQAAPLLNKYYSNEGILTRDKMS